MPQSFTFKYSNTYNDSPAYLYFNIHFSQSRGEDKGMNGSKHSPCNEPFHAFMTVRLV